MSLLTENKLLSVFDLPIALPATTLKQGDWLTVATVKLGAGQALSIKSLTLQLIAATVTVADIDPTNLVVPNLGLAYVVVRQNYVSGSPSAAGAFDTLSISDLGAVSRSELPLVITETGYYSVVVVNNLQASTASAISTATAIDLDVCITGQFRLSI